MIARIIYKRMPLPQNKVNKTKRSRTAATFQPKNSAIPLHTPDKVLFFDFRSCFDTLVSKIINNADY